ncbi:MAG: hypothetical protein IH875_10870 [Candidatus Dadabacteria bacterium]|nr:hypothetical protein [Candidatus Dadabacteria bacterium]
MLLTEALGINFSQAECDFVIPDLDQDRHLCIDPFLLYKSRDFELRNLHDSLITVFNRAFDSFKNGNSEELDRLINFPEVSEIGLGYSQGSVRGSGMGTYLNKIVTETLVNSPELVERGIKHIEELQLVSLGIGADRISDMAANILKKYLITYTQRQSLIWSIPVTSGVPVNHIFDIDKLEWVDEYIDLPTNPNNGSPLIFVLRRIVRLLPWINYDDFERTDFKMFLSSSKQQTLRNRLSGSKKERSSKKEDVTKITRKEIHLLDSYVKRKESNAADAQPQLYSHDTILPGTPTAKEFMKRLNAIPTGMEHAHQYQLEALAILNHLFEPELTEGKIEERTIHGTERRDIIFTNESDRSFWQYARQNYGDFLIMFEAKNVSSLTNAHLAQTAIYMGDRIGYLAFVITRNPPSKAQKLKCFSIYNDSGGNSRKVIIVIDDEDVNMMLKMRESGNYPTRHIQQKYRDFKIECQ